MMNIPETLEDLNNLIINKVEENLTLDYKAAGALQNTDGKKKEIAKDVSAMANSAGGVIIYGIKEFDSKDKSHLPESITPIKRTNFSKEQLEHIIHNNISPKIENLIIHPIQLSYLDEVAYIVEIPQSTTAHQNTKDFKYYKRFNFESVAMSDYEIRDTMNREKHPHIVLEFEIQTIVLDKSDPMGFTNIINNNNSKPEKLIENTLYISTLNKGSVFANYVNYFIEIPIDMLPTGSLNQYEYASSTTLKVPGSNTHRDVVDVANHGPFGCIPKYGPTQYVPILPSLYGVSNEFELTKKPVLDDRFIYWTVYADNSKPITGKIKLKDIKYNYKDNSSK